MERIDQKELLKAGVHFGHLKRKWNPKMLQYIFMEKKGIHLIDLNKTSDKLLEAAAAMKQITASGRKIMFVATKKQAKETVKEIIIIDDNSSDETSNIINNIKNYYFFNSFNL